MYYDPREERGCPRGQLLLGGVLGLSAVQQLVDELDPVTHRPGRSALKMRLTADIRCDDLLRLAFGERGDLVLAQTAGEIRVKD